MEIGTRNGIFLWSLIDINEDNNIELRQNTVNKMHTSQVCYAKKFEVEGSIYTSMTSQTT